MAGDGAIMVMMMMMMMMMEMKAMLLDGDIFDGINGSLRKRDDTAMPLLVSP